MTGLVASSGCWLGVGVAIFAYEVWVLVLLCRTASYSHAQKAGQVALVVLLPLVGAVVAHWFASHGVAPLPQRDREFEPREVDGA